MIIVPVEENHERIAGLSDARFRAADYGGSGLEAVGAGLAKLGEGGQQFASALDVKRQLDNRAIDLGDRHRRNLDDAAAKKAYVAFSNAAAPLLHGDDGILNRVGADAHDVFPDVAAGFADAYDKALAPLDPELRAAVAPALAERVRTYIALSGEHVREQGAVEQRRQSAELQQVAARDAVAHATNPDLHDHYMATGENAIRQQARIEGLPPEDAEQQVADYVSRTHADTVDALTARDPARAADWYARYGDAMSDQDRGTVMSRLGPALARLQAVADVDAAGQTGAMTAPAANSGSVPFASLARTPGSSQSAAYRQSDVDFTSPATDAGVVAGDTPFEAAELAPVQHQPQEVDGAPPTKPAGKPPRVVAQAVIDRNRTQAESDLRDPYFRALMTLIGRYEGPDNPNFGNGYYTINGHLKKGDGLKDLSRFPDEVGDTAVGRYQIKKSGVYGFAASPLGITSFTPHDQDLMAAYTIRHRGMYAALSAGDFPKAAVSISRIWASFPTKGKSGGVHRQAHTDYETFVKDFQAELARSQATGDDDANPWLRKIPMGRLEYYIPGR